MGQVAPLPDCLLQERKLHADFVASPAPWRPRRLKALEGIKVTMKTRKYNEHGM